ncbi:MAG: hypothetical protein O7I93_17835 [Gemmatimonadetes bacterium]|nr:hypothetical protein [Gemmatimonadota bacterium]
MMLEIWWKVFLLGLVIAAVARLLGSGTNFVALFFLASVVVLVLFIVGMVVYGFFSERKRSKDEG